MCRLYHPNNNSVEGYSLSVPSVSGRRPQINSHSRPILGNFVLHLRVRAGCLSVV